MDRPALSPAKVASVVFALVVHAVTLAVVVTGAYVTVTNFPHLVAWVVGIPLLLLGVLLRPRLGALQNGTVLMPPDAAPTLYGLVNKIAAEIGARPVDIIALDADFNASHGQIGLRRRRILWIGLAMWNALDDRERIALLGHEMAHQVNGDLAYGFVVGSAVRTLAEWHAVLRTPGRHQTWGSLGEGLEALGELVAAAALGLLRAGVERLIDLESSLRYVSQQRAEYFADLLSARVASTSAAISMLDHLFIARLGAQAVYYAARRDEADVWKIERRFLDELSPKEWERLRRLHARRGTRIDATHPPTNLRIELLRQQVDLPGTITLSAADSHAIEAELDSGFKLVGEHLATRFSS